MKRIAAIMIASLFVLTAFVVVEMPQNATVNHIPVLFTYSQNSPAKPYVATSNGLTYTVEPNGTYLWNGHYLRAPPVPYPKVPTIAPDGLPYGAVGKIGAQGQVGAKSFPKGTAQITGVSPATTAGTDTLISVNTFWGNETITLVGNVTIENGISLTIYNSNITFSEPASTTSYAYGFNVSYNGAGKLYFRHGTVITQSSPSATNSWFIWGTGAVTGYGIPYGHSLPLVENFTVIATNSTIEIPSNNTPHLAYHITSGGWYNPDGMAGFQFSYFNYSTYKGYGNYNPRTSLNVTNPSHNSYFTHGWVITQNPYNDTFNDTTIGIGGQSYGFDSGSLKIIFDTVINETSYEAKYFTDLNPGIMMSANSPASNGGAGYVDVNNSLFKNINETGNPQFGLVMSGFAKNEGTSSQNYITNTSMINIWSDSASNQFFEGFIGSSSTNSFGSFQAMNTTTIIKHVTIQNVTASSILGGSGGGPGLMEAPIGYDTVYEYNLINGMHNVGGREPTPFSVSTWAYNFSYNIVLNYTDTIGTPAYQNAVFNVGDHGTQIYGVAGGGPPGDFISGQSTALTPSHPANMTRIVSHNYFANVEGQSWFFQVTGWYVNINNNTFVNMDSAGGIGVSVNSGGAFVNVTDNSFYGVYNYSLAVGSNEGGAWDTHYSGNQFYDVDATSYSMNTMDSYEYWSNENGNIFIYNDNGTNSAGSIGLHEKLGHTTDVYLENSTFTQIVLGGIPQGGSVPTRYVLPNDFNITIYNSYVPVLWPVFDGNSGSYYSKPVNPFLFSNGPYTLSAPYSNSYFLNLTGYLGIYPSQTYTLNASNIKGESSLPVYLAGSQIAAIPTSSAHYNLTASYSSGTLEYTLSANSASDQPISLMWNGQVPNTEYSVAMYDHGKLIDYTNVTSSADGVVTFTYNPATMPLDPVFELTTISASMPPSTPVSNTFLYLEIGLIAVLSVGLVIPLIIRRQYR